MKHIFTIHSPLTFLIAYTVISQKKIHETDVIILSSGYTPPVKLNYVKSAFQDVNRGFFKKIKTWNSPLAFDRYINSLTKGSDFIAYIDLMAIYQRILVTNPKCKSFSFIEEGSASYIQPRYLDQITHAFRKIPYRYNSIKDFSQAVKYILRGYSIRLLAMSYLPESYENFKDTHYYCLSEDAFPQVVRHKRTVLNLTGSLPLLEGVSTNISLTNEFIWIEDSFTQTYKMSHHAYKKAILSTIFYLKEKYPIQKVYLKLRPRQTKEESLVYKYLNQEKFDIEVIMNNAIIEVLLANSKECTVIGNVSSVLFYAPLLGHKSLSMFNLLKNKPRTTFDDFSVFWKNIIKI